MGSLRWDIVRRMLPAGPQLTILEIGCGQGAVGSRLAEQYDYLGVELDAVSAQTAIGRVAELGRGEVRHGDLSAVEPGRTFDVVVAFEVIEHIEDDAAALIDWVGRLRPGGQLILSTPAYPARYGAMDAMVGHYRRYEPEALVRLLRAAGLEEVTVTHYGMPIAYAIEPVRNVIARYRQRRTGTSAVPVSASAPAAASHSAPAHGSEALDSASGPSMAERTGNSGRTLQPSGRAEGAAIQLVTAPLKAVQRRFPQRGPVIVASGRRSGA